MKNTMYIAKAEYQDNFGPEGNKPMTIAELEYLAKDWGMDLDAVIAQCDEVDAYEAACALGAIRKTQMLKELRSCPAKYVSYGDGDLGMAVLKSDAITDIEAMDDASIGDGTWYPCDKDGKELTSSQLAAAALGASRSEAKTRTARENGSKGGRPKDSTIPLTKFQFTCKQVSTSTDERMNGTSLYAKTRRSAHTKFSAMYRKTAGFTYDSNNWKMQLEDD